MEGNKISRVWTQGAAVEVENLRGTAFTEEAKAHIFRISGKDAQGGDLALSGTVLGKFLRADNVTIDISGSVSGGVASLALVGDCYHAPGRCSLVIYLSDGTTTVAIYACVGSVYRATSGTELDSGTTVPSLAQLEGAYNSAVAAAANANSAATAAQQTASEAAAAAQQTAEDAAAVALAAAEHSVRYDVAQSLTTAQKTRARQNAGSNSEVGLYLDSDGYICQN